MSLSETADYWVRLRHAATEWKRALQEAQDQMAIRDELIKTGVDAGYPMERIAQAALVSRKRIEQILGRDD